MSQERDAAAIDLFSSWISGWMVTSWEARRAVLGVQHQSRVAHRAVWTGRQREVVLKTEYVERSQKTVQAPPDPHAENLWLEESESARRARTLRVCVCRACVGAKRVKCPDCQGSTEIRCEECDGKGHYWSTRSKRDVSCRKCGGDGLRKCKNCSKGTVACDDCDAKGQVACWLELREQAITTTRWAGDPDLVDVMSRPSTPLQQPGITVASPWQGRPGTQPPNIVALLGRHPELQVNAREGQRYDQLEVHEVEGVLSTVRFELAGSERSLRMVTDTGKVVEDPETHAPGRLRAALIATFGIFGLLGGAAVTLAYRAAHPWYAEMANATSLEVLSGALGLACALLAAAWALPATSRSQPVRYAAAGPAVLGVVMALQFLGGTPSVAHAREALAAGQPTRAEREARACAELGIGDAEALRLLDELALAAVEKEQEPAACWKLTKRTWADADLKERAERVCFDRTMAKIDADQTAGTFASTGPLIAGMEEPWRSRPDARERATKASRAVFDGCVRNVDVACAKGALDELTLAGTPQDVTDARRHADKVAHKLFDTGWNDITKRKGSLEDRAKKCDEIRPAVGLLEAVGTPGGKPTVAEVDTACGKVVADRKVEQERAVAAAEKAKAAAAARATRRVEAEARSWSSGRLRCADGTLSPTCTCGGSHRGCCSHHGGVAGCN